MADTRLSGYEATEAALGEWTRPESPDWTTVEEFSRGRQPVDLIPAGRWPAGGAA